MLMLESIIVSGVLYMKTKKPKRTTKGPVRKEDVLFLIQNEIRNIQMNDYGTDSGIPQLYHIMSLIEEMPLSTPDGDEMIRRV